MSEEESNRRPTVRLHDDSDTEAFNTMSGVHRVVTALEAKLAAIGDKQSVKSRVSLVTMLMAVLGTGGVGTIAVQFNSILERLGIWSAERGVLSESKVSAAGEHKRLDGRIDAMNVKLDNLPRKVADEVRRRR